MTREEAIKSALKFLVLKQTEQGSWGYSDRNENEISWDKVLEWLDQQPCGDCISRQEAIRIAEQGQIQGYVWQFKKLCTLPSVEPERKTGKWHVEGFNVWCTSCGFHPKAIEVFDYCPNCGAKMEVEDR